MDSLDKVKLFKTPCFSFTGEDLISEENVKRDERKIMYFLPKLNSLQKEKLENLLKKKLNERIAEVLKIKKEDGDGTNSELQYLTPDLYIEFIKQKLPLTTYEHLSIAKEAGVPPTWVTKKAEGYLPGEQKEDDHDKRVVMIVENVKEWEDIVRYVQDSDSECGHKVFHDMDLDSFNMDTYISDVLGGDPLDAEEISNPPQADLS